jgi:uncharacterized protein
MRYLFSCAVAILLVFALGRAHAEIDGPSFDCGKAAEISEKIICGNGELSKLDVELATRYRARLAELDRVGQNALRRDEKRWVDHRARFCAPPLAKPDTESRAACIEHYYRQRIAALRADCEVDNDRSLEEMAAQKQPWSAKLPKGFSAQRDVEIYRNNEWVQVYNLPSATLPAAKVAGWGMRCCGNEWLVTCKSKGPDGTDWLVLYGAESLGYAPLSTVKYTPIPTPNLEPASIYDAKVARENKERREELK